MKCENCKNDHDGSYGSGRFCSEKCSRSFSTKKNRKDINNKVSKALKGRPSKNKGLKFSLTEEQIQNLKTGLAKQRKEKKDNLINLWLKGEHSGLTKSGCIYRFVKQYLRKKFNNSCSQCGWNEINIYTGKSPLEIDHIDGNSLNNKETNLRLLCPNCHSLTPTWKALNKGCGNKERLRRHKLGVIYE